MYAWFIYISYSMCICMAWQTLLRTVNVVSPAWHRRHARRKYYSASSFSSWKCHLYHYMSVLYKSFVLAGTLSVLSCSVLHMALVLPNCIIESDLNSLHDLIKRLWTQGIRKLQSVASLCMAPHQCI